MDKYFCENYKFCNYNKQPFGSMSKCMLMEGCEKDYVYDLDHNMTAYCGYVMKRIKVKTEFEVLMEEAIEKNNT